MKKILFASDFHGNIIKYKKLLNYSLENNIESIILGGDLAPNKGHNYIQTQRRFLESNLPDIFKPIEDKIPIYAILGNDDCKTNLTFFERNFINQIHDNRMKLSEDFDIVGYSNVPITPFGIKDWEKYDLTRVKKELREEYEKRIRENYKIKGVKSKQNGFRQYNLRKFISQTIQSDLKKEVYTKNPEKTIYVMHSPPNNTNLDVLLNKNHVGSFAIREFIEQYQPYLTLHGHIHETVYVTGKFKEKMGNTFAMTAGNDTYSDKLPILLLDIYNPEKTQRIIL